MNKAEQKFINEQRKSNQIIDFEVQDNFSPDVNTLEKLAETVHATGPLSKEVVLNYEEWFSQQKGIQLRLPWEAHLTASRFLEKKPPEVVQELLNFFKNGESLGESKPEFVDVGHFIFTPEGFNYKVYERFNLR